MRFVISARIIGVFITAGFALLPTVLYAGTEVLLNDPSLASAVPESLMANSPSGGFVYTYSLALPPGRNGLEPTLALTYNSQETDPQSIVGYGWSLPIPYIERLNHQGLEDLYEGTSFYASLSSGELVPISLSDTQHGTYGSRVDDGSFLSYTFDVSDESWTVEDTFGRTYLFGSSTDSRLDNAHTGDGSQVYRWMLEEVRDANDNFVTYAYQKDQGQIYPSKITYTGHGSTEGIFVVSFSYESRSDVPVMYKTGFSVSSTQRLDIIAVVVNGVTRQIYDLRYTTGDNGTRSLLAGITTTDYAESAEATSLPETTFTYSSSTPSWTKSSSYSVPVDIVTDNGWSVTDAGARFADVDGDGRVDMLRDNYTYQDDVYLNNDDDTGWTEQTGWDFPMSYVDSSYEFADDFVNSSGYDHGVRFADVNGDGFVDLLYGRDWASAQKTYLNNGDGTGWTRDTSWELPTVFVNDNGWMVVDSGLRLMEVNGDGLVDLVLGQYGDQRVFLNDGDGAGWTQDSGYSLPIYFITSGGYDNGVREADVNGDGLDDLIYGHQGRGNAVYINTGDGTGWTLDSSYSVPIDFINNDGVSITDAGGRIIDVNGDALPDLVYQTYYGTDAIYINDGDGTGWTKNTSYSWPVDLLGAGGYHNGAVPLDVNADGLVDIVYAKNTEAHYVSLHDGLLPDLLTEIKEFTGKAISLTYQTAPADENATLPFPVTVLSSSTVDDGFGNSSVTTYEYADGAYYYAAASDRRFAGFGKVTTTNDLGESTTTYLHQGNGDDSASEESSDSYAKIGKVYRNETRDDSGALVKTTVTTWGEDDLGDGNAFVHQDEGVELTYDADGSHSDTAVAFVHDSTTGNLTAKTEYGEVSASADGSFSDVGSDKRSTAYTYATDTAVVIVGLPSSTIVTDDSLATVSKMRYTYDGLAFGSVQTGNVTQQEQWISGTDYAATTFTYDAYGNVLTQTDPLGNTTTTVYDTYNLYPATITNALSQIQTFEYDEAVGKPTSFVDVSSAVTETDYDGLGRPIEERRSSDAVATTLETTKIWSYFDDLYYPSYPRSIKLREYLSETKYKETINYLDGFDRTVETKIFDDDGTGYNETETSYDTLGRVASTTLAEVSAGWEYDASTVSSSLSESYAYDALSRLTETTNILGTTTTVYDGFAKTVTDSASNTKDYVTDGLGRLVAVVEYLDSVGYTTSYEWSGADKLTKTTDALGNVRNFTYDGRGLRLTAEDLHDSTDTTFGTWVSTYDDGGNLSTSLSPNGVTVTYLYDALNRQTSEDASDGTGVEVSYAYDSCTNGTGKLCKATTSDGVTTASVYTASGRLASEIKTISAVNYTTSYTYDTLGNILTTTHPDGTIVTNTYNTLGLLETVQKKSATDTSNTDVITDTDYGPHGEVTSQTNGDGTVTTYTYDETQRYRLASKVTTGYESGGTSTTTTTTVNFYPTAGDGYVYKSDASWGTAHAATSGSSAYYTSSFLLAGTGKTTKPYYLLYRTFLPFDTSSIPDDATITAAKLNVYPYLIKDNDDDGDDFITVVQTSQASTTALTTADFDQAGSIDNPTEGIDSTERKDITDVSKNAYLTLNLNATGLGWISNTGVTKLGLREGHDVKNSAFTSSSTTSSQYNYLYIRSSEYTGTTYDPYLSVTYTQTTTTAAVPVAATLQDLSYTYDDVGNITQIVDASDTDTKKTTAYTYDDLYRLTSATVSGAADGNNGTITYAYDILGNITSRSDDGTYTYAGDSGTSYANPHAVTSILKTDGTTQSFTYDNNGNLTSDGTTTYTWDWRNRLTASGVITTMTTTIPATTVTTTSAPTTVTFYPSAGDGYVFKSNASWGTAHDATTGDGVSGTASTAMIMTGKSSTNYYIYRALLPFDTSSLPDDATITSATLKMYVTGKVNNDNDDDDFVTVVQSTQASATALATSDYGKTGATDNPTEGVATTGRQDISSVSAFSWLTFTLNSTGQGFVSKTGSTNLALREGHDVKDSAFTSTSTTSSQYNYLYIHSSEYTGTTYDPVLSVTYTTTSTTIVPATTTTTTTTTNEVTYAYDHGMQRVSKTSDSGTTYYPTSDYSVEDGTSTVYVSGSAGLTASIEYDGKTATTDTIHTDHLGSTSVVTDEDGIMVELLDYNPYGTERISWSSSSSDGEAESQKTYIGEYSDDESGLSYLNARYYDPERGQFLSQDIVNANFGSGSLIDVVLLRDPQSQNGYLYARGNPVSFVDPEGEFWGEVGSFFAGLTNAIVSDNTFGAGRVNSSDAYYNTGQSVGDAVATAQGIAEMAVGVTIGVGGTATGVAVTAGSVGVLAPAGAGVSVGAAVAGAAIATHGAGTAGTGMYNLMEGSSSAKNGWKVGEAGGVGAGKNFPQSVKNTAREQAGNRCVFCGGDTTRSSGPNQSQIDHAVPKVSGGNNTIQNAQNTCRTCNLQKGTQTSIGFISKVLNKLLGR